MINLTIKRFLVPIFVGVAILFFSAANFANAAVTGPLYGWAWSENIGWISFNCANFTSGCATSNYAVSAANGVLSGYAWSNNIGWISFNSFELTGCPSGACSAAISDAGAVSGWAKALAADGNGWDGWIKLNGSTYGALLDAVSGDFSGYTWSDSVVGWVSFNCSNLGSCATSNYKVSMNVVPIISSKYKCSDTPVSCVSDNGDGTGTYTESTCGGACGSSGGTSCSNSTCVTDSAATANNCNSNEFCGGTPPPGGGTPQHSICSNNACVLINESGYDECVFNSDCPPGGTPSTPSYGICSSSNTCIRLDGTAPIDAVTCSNYGATGSCVTDPCNNNGICDAGETSATCSAECVPGYSLTSSNDLSITQIGGGVECSNQTKISIAPVNGYNSDVTLAVGDWGGFAEESYAFLNNTTGATGMTDTLTSAQYTAGSQFSVCAQSGASPGTYTIRIDGAGGKTVNVKVNVSKKEPKFQETSLWRLLAGIWSWFQ